MHEPCTHSHSSSDSLSDSLLSGSCHTLAAASSSAVGEASAAADSMPVAEQVACDLAAERMRRGSSVDEVRIIAVLGDCLPAVQL